MGKRTAPVFCCSPPGFAMSCRRSNAQRKSGPEACSTAHTVTAGRCGTGLWPLYGADAAGLALLLTSLSDDVVLLTNGDSNLESDDASELDDDGMMVIDDDGRTDAPGVFGAGDATVGKAAVCSLPRPDPGRRTRSTQGWRTEHFRLRPLASSES
jgi:hypothetical protein